MRKQLALAALSLVLVGGTSGAGPNPTWVAELNKAGRDPNAIFLGGAGTALYGIPTRAEAYALAKGHKGKTGSFVGYIWAVKLDGNRASIEVIPNFTGESGRRCTGLVESHRLACMVRTRAVFKSSVTCHLNNWHTLNDATGGTLFTDVQTKWQRRAGWNHVVVEGRIQRAEDRAVAFGSYGGSGGDFGLGGGYQKQGFQYRTIHIDRCRVLTFRGQAVRS